VSKGNKLFQKELDKIVRWINLKTT
jgi:hypothetical protein